MIALDANILVSSVFGRHVAAQVERLIAADVELAAPVAQIEEARRVVGTKLALGDEALRSLTIVCNRLRCLDASELASLEQVARARLHPRAQSDWPVLAAAIRFDGHVWSNDRDLFGVGVPVWSTRNIHLYNAEMRAA